MGIFIQKNGTRYPIGGGTKQLEQRLAEIELSRASATGYGLVKLSDASGVTDSTGLALPTSEKDPARPGTMAHDLELVKQNSAKLEESRLFYPSLASVGTSSTFILDIVKEMKRNSVLVIATPGTGLHENQENKIPTHAGVLTIEKTGSYARVIYTHNTSGGTNGNTYIASIDTNAHTLNGWYVMEGKLIE